MKFHEISVCFDSTTIHGFLMSFYMKMPRLSIFQKTDDHGTFYTETDEYGAFHTQDQM